MIPNIYEMVKNNTGLFWFAEKLYQSSWETSNSQGNSEIDCYFCLLRLYSSMQIRTSACLLSQKDKPIKFPVPNSLDF